MTKAYSLDLRGRVVRFVDGGHSCHEAAAHFDVSVSFVVKLAAAFRRNGYRYKKTLLASKQDRPDVAAARREWIAKRQPRMRREAHRLVFVDETGTTTKMVRTRGRCARNLRLKGQAPFGHWKTQTFIAGLRRLLALF